MQNKGSKNIRYNILTIFIYIVATILIIQLFNLQIIQGKYFLAQSSTRLTRETTQNAARGNILDRNGNILATTKLKYTLELYKSKVDNKTLNDTILKTIKTLEKNDDKYKKDTFPIALDNIIYTKEEKTIKQWLKSKNLNENLKAEELFNKYKEKYEINNIENILDIRKVIGIRYEAEINGYTTRTPYVLADNISEKSVAIFEESSILYPGLSIKTTPVREYLNGTLASHILGYVGAINR